MQRLFFFHDPQPLDFHLKGCRVSTSTTPFISFDSNGVVSACSGVKRRMFSLMRSRAFVSVGNRGTVNLAILCSVCVRGKLNSGGFSPPPSCGVWPRLIVFCCCFLVFNKKKSNEMSSSLFFIFLKKKVSSHYDWESYQLLLRCLLWKCSTHTFSQALWSLS